MCTMHHDGAETSLMASDNDRETSVPESVSEMPPAAKRLKRSSGDRPGIEGLVAQCLRQRNSELAEQLANRIIGGETASAGTMVQLMFLLGREGCVPKAQELYCHMKDRGMAGESAMSVLAKAAGDAGDSETVLLLYRDILTLGEVKKLRTFLPILKVLCETPGLLGQAIELLGRMVELGLGPGDDELSLVASGCASQGSQYDLHRVLSIYHDRLLLRTLSRVAMTALAAAGRQLRAEVQYTQADSQGLCSLCSRPVGSRLSTANRERLLQSLLSLVERDVGTKQLERLLEFKNWLAERPMFDFVIDGANVAYRGQNFEGGGFNFEQIDIILEELQNLGGGSRALVVLPQRYGQAKRVPSYTRADHKVRRRIRRDCARNNKEINSTKPCTDTADATIMSPNQQSNDQADSVDAQDNVVSPSPKSTISNDLATSKDESVEDTKSPASTDDHSEPGINLATMASAPKPDTSQQDLGTEAILPTTPLDSSEMADDTTLPPVEDQETKPQEEQPADASQVTMDTARRRLAARPVSEADEALLQKWRNMECLYETPRGVCDDWYMLLASMAATDEDAGRGPIVVSNDQLRDHQAGVALPALFHEWAVTHTARYEFQHAVSSDRPLPFVMIVPPPNFVTTLTSEPVEGDKSQIRWHVPGTAPVDGNIPWLCLTLDSKINK